MIYTQSFSLLNTKVTTVHGKATEYMFTLLEIKYTYSQFVDTKEAVTCHNLLDLQGNGK